jgi:hypothetical protein
VIRVQAHLARDGRFSWAGGTGLSLRLDHRLSDDIDRLASAVRDQRKNL